MGCVVFITIRVFNNASTFFSSFFAIINNIKILIFLFDIIFSESEYKAVEST